MTILRIRVYKITQKQNLSTHKIYYISDGWHNGIILSIHWLERKIRYRLLLIKNYDKIFL